MSPRSCRGSKGVLLVTVINSLELLVYIVFEDQYLYNNCNNLFSVVSNLFCISNTVLFMLNLVSDDDESPSLLLFFFFFPPLVRSSTQAEKDQERQQE